MSKEPTLIEYQEALRNKYLIQDWMQRENDNLYNLIDKVSASKEMIDSYKQLLANAEETIFRYQFYQEAKRGDISV